MWRGKIWHGLLGQQCCPNRVATTVAAFTCGADTGGAQREQPRRRRPSKAALLEIGYALAAAPVGPADEAGAPEAVAAPARQDEMSKDKSQRRTVERRAATRSRDAALLRSATADPGTPLPQGLYDPALDKDSCGVGFIADIKGRKSHQIVEDGLRILCNLEHRGAVGADPRMGDGAGILVQIPHKFFAKKTAELGFKLPKPGEYAVGYLFMPKDPNWRQIIRDIYAEVIAREGLSLLGWREVPTDNSTLGEFGQADRADASASVHRPRQEEILRGRVRAPALHPAQVDLRCDLSPPRAPHRRLLPGVDLLPHGDLQGHVPRRPARRLLSRPARSGLRERARAGAPAFLDQHLPDLVAGASLPLHRA